MKSLAAIDPVADGPVLKRVSIINVPQRTAASFRCLLALASLADLWALRERAQSTRR
jgi:hypothetical protein